MSTLLQPLKQILQKIQKLLRRSNETSWNSASYWEMRYRSGGSSGEGSYGRLATFKAEVINALVREEKISSVIEHGCGDGNQLSFATYPRYQGFDISSQAIYTCRQRYSFDKTKIFKPSSEYRGETADMALSLDVIYHLTEDTSFTEYMERLTQSASRLIIIYSTNIEQVAYSLGNHVRHRCFSEWMKEYAHEWTMYKHIPNRYPFIGDTSKSSAADFWIYKHTKDSDSQRHGIDKRSKPRAK